METPHDTESLVSGNTGINVEAADAPPAQSMYDLLGSFKRHDKDPNLKFGDVSV